MSNHAGRMARCGFGCVALLASASGAQSLFTTPVSREPAPAMSVGSAEPAAELYAMSMVAVRPPTPRDYRVHDLITIVIDEQSKSTSSQTLETEKESSAKVGVNGLIDPWELLETRLRQGGLSNLTLLDADAEREFKGEGDYERTDQFSARITAEIIDIKPNGNLVLEARKQIVRDGEESDLVLSGVCRRDDVTSQNTVLSSQMSSLRVEQRNSGAVKRAATKGVLTNLLDTIFNF